MVRIIKKCRNQNVKRLILLVFLSLFLAIVVSPTAVVAQIDSCSDVTASMMETPHSEYRSTQLPAEVGKPVQWVKQVDVQNLYDQTVSELTVTIPEGAMNVVVTDIRDKRALDAIVDSNEVTIIDSLGFNEQKTYVIKYETPAPEKSETPLTRDGEKLVKNVIVSSEEHYEDVLTYTAIPEIENAEDVVKLYWNINGMKTDVTDDPEFDFRFYDTDGDGLYDQISWIAPHLSTQIFEIIIFSDVDPGSYTDIGITLQNPADGEYIMSTNRVNFNYSVQYNSSTTVYCNLTIDGMVRRENIPTLADTEITTYFNLSSGQHSWFVSCQGDDGAANTSETRTFTIDLDNPVVTLNTADYYVSYENSIRLNFTPTDTKYPVMVCSLSINGALNRTGLIVSNNTKATILIPNLANGVYDWNVSCEDAASNIGRSEERVFYISAGTPSEFNISPNKDVYGMGEIGYLIINARTGSDLTMFVDSPNHESFFRYFTGETFPLVEMINFTNSAGTYNIDGIFTEGGDTYIVKTSFEVTNSFNVDIDANKTTGEPDETFKFEASSSGGIGNVSYEWDFGDDTTATGQKVEHKYGSVGEYEVEVTATDNKGNKVTDTQKINIFNKHNLQITIRELQTQHVMGDVPVEVDDERKYTNSKGMVNFTVYEGKRRIYVAYEGYEWVKQVRNITEDLAITIELNNTDPNYTYSVEDEVDTEASAEAGSAKQEAEALLAQVSAAMESLNSNDQATKAVMTSLGVEAGLQKARKQLRQVIRDLGNAESPTDMETDERESKIEASKKVIDELKSTITSIDVQDTTEFVDYPRASDISMVSEEYLMYKKLEYTKRKKQNYIKQNTELQTEVTFTTRLSVVDIEMLSGDKKTISVVINKLTKMPVDTAGMLIAEYIPKEAAQSVSEIIKLTEFEVIKSDPILKFSPDTESYAYYIDSAVDIEKLKKTKHIMLREPETKDEEGLAGVTGFSILSLMHIDNPKLAIELALIIMLLLAYIAYHFELIDRLKEWRKGKQTVYETDMAYQPESRLESMFNKIKTFIKKEDELLVRELAHIRSLIVSAHKHAAEKDHDKASKTYGKIMESYKDLSREAKSNVHQETKHVFNRILLSKIDHLLDEAHIHLQNKDHDKAQSHYSEIKTLYAKLEKEHRAAVSERCMRLHERLFETSLT